MIRVGAILRLVLSSLFKKPATLNYPKVRSGMPEGFRGKLDFHPEKCIGCKMCMRDCPSGAINIVMLGPKVFQAEIDLAKCIYCAQCVDTCPKKALEITGEFELAQLDIERLKITIRGDAGKNPKT